MRWMVHIIALTVMVCVAAWSLFVTSGVRDDLKETRRLRANITEQREAIQVLRAEWAWLNAPARLERLVSEHAADLGLEPMTPERFAYLSEIEEPAPDDGLAPIALIDLDDLTAPVLTAPAPRPRPRRAN